MSARTPDSTQTLLPDDFPPGLLEIPSAPEQLFVRGKLPPEGTRCLAVVGSRALSSYGREACEMLIAGLAGYPISIISGLALGADACAHKAALRAGLHTVAVLGSGLADSVIGPPSNFGLAKEILESGGALVSEYPPEEISYPGNFPARNRIVVGLSRAVLLVEAGERSGTLITARLAGEYNRDLLCVPHRIGDRNSAGIHQFMRLGATPVSEPAHILEALGFSTDQGDEARIVSIPELSDTEAQLYALLEEPRPRDELIRASGLSAGAALTTLVTLELRGLIKEEFGAWRRRT